MHQRDGGLWSEKIHFFDVGGDVLLVQHLGAAGACKKDKKDWGRD